MKKSILFFAAFALIASSVMTSCKKGEDDPFLSLRSRKARFAGEWKVAEFTETREVNNGGITYNEADSYDGTTWTRQQYNFISGEADNYQYTVNEWTYNITKEGKFTYTFDRTLNSLNDSVVDTEFWVTTQEGYWQFLGKNKAQDFKKKERAALTLDRHILEINETNPDTLIIQEHDLYEMDPEGDIWIMNMLKNKEMVVTWSTSHSIVEEGITVTTERTMKLTQD